MYECLSGGTFAKFWRVIKHRADGKFECLGDLALDVTSGYAVVDETAVCAGYPPTPDKDNSNVPKVYKAGSATLVGPEPGKDSLSFTELDLELTANQTITSIAFSANGTNDTPVYIKAGCGPEDCSLIALGPTESLSWSEANGLTPPIFALTIPSDDEGSTVRNMVEITYTICEELT